MGKLSCLIIDDDFEEIEIFKIALRIFPDVCLSHFLQSAAAIDYLTNISVPPDYIFIDLNMPIIHGKELISRIRKLHHMRQTPVYTYTTSSLPKDKRESLEAGATGFVTKPANLNSLIETLKEIFKK